ncbi:unnamed protein product [Caenorhabditis nigoni]|uniref:Uncharacterized protein n=1 Tax=Caenorhabditis nigoni TaxID=1611254 RepID=A0A2G5TGW2_9PELO|nr:hypothetical protein B9Z55_019070 [Caenorhabditis nigoni]
MARSAPEKNLENSLKTPYVFYKDRLASFKNYKYDSDQNATCTSKALARAGFVFSGETSAVCPFCVKCLDFDPEDDPWEEHKNRCGDICEFVRIGKLDDSQLTFAETIALATHATTTANFKKFDAMIEHIRGKSLIDLVMGENKKAAKPSTTKTSRRAK